MSDIFEVLKELDISNVEVSGFKDKHFMRINLDMEDLEKLNVHYYQHLLNLIYQSKIKNRILEKALDKACKELHDNQMSEAGIDEDLHGIHPNFINAEEWKEWCMKGD